MTISELLVRDDTSSDILCYSDKIKCLSYVYYNIKTLQNFDKIQYKDTNDNAKILTVLEKTQQLAMNKKQAEVYCHD